MQRVIREAGAFGIDVHVIARREVPPAKTAKAAKTLGGERSQAALPSRANVVRARRA